MSRQSPFVAGCIVPGLPHPLLAPEKNAGWGRLRDAFAKAREDIARSGADVLVLYSTMWPSVIGHQVQAHPAPEWVHVDELFHELGSIPYKFRGEPEVAAATVAAATERGLMARSIAYDGFPIDTGSVVALKLLNPDNALPAVILSSNVYADRAETMVLAKSVRDALEATGRRAAAVVVSTLSNRLFTDWIKPEDDHIHSPKDDEWNRKVLEFLAAGRLEDVSQLSREIHRQIRIGKVVNFKPMWWLAAAMGQHNRFEGRVHAYEALYGTGAAVVSLSPSGGAVHDKEFDEDDVERFAGDREVLQGAPGGAKPPAAPTPAPTPRTATPGPVASSPVASSPVASSPVASGPVASGPVAATHATTSTARAPAPVGAYPHARRVGDLLYLSGVGPRQPVTNDIPGGPIRDASGAPLDYDIEAQTRAVIENVRVILEDAGSSLDRVVDITAFLVDMDRDFAGYNSVYRETFEAIQATRTTLAVSALPTPIAVEFKVIALPGPAVPPATTP
jgi:reactive intermediate/imine deaminase